MFECRVSHPVHLRSFALLGIGLVGAALLALVWLQPPRPEIVVSAAAPSLAVEARSESVSPPIVVEAPRAPAQPEPEPAAIGTSCVADVTTVGEPLGEQLDYDEVLAGAQIDPDGCTIAAWTKDRLFVSWDGGATFATHVVGGASGSVVVTRGRVAMVRSGNALGTVRAGDRTPVWRELGVLAGGPQSYEPVLSAAGRWTLAYLSSAQRFAVTDDDGATWRPLTPPVGAQVWVTEDGRTWARRWQWNEEERDGDEPIHDHAERVEHYVAAAGTSTWRNADAAIRKAQAAWSYELRTDRSWGCGGTEKIVALHHGREVATLVNELYPQTFSPEIVSRGNVAFAMYRENRSDDELPERLHRLRGTRSIDLGELPFHNVAHLVGVDRYETLIAFDGASVLRWSEG